MVCGFSFTVAKYYGKGHVEELVIGRVIRYQMKALSVQIDY